MSKASLTSQAKVMAHRAKLQARTLMLQSPIRRVKYRGIDGDHLLIIPQSLRTADPSFSGELADKLLGLAGAVAHLGDKSPFDIEPPNVAWLRALHGFSWLRHLRAVDDDDARRLGRVLVEDWIGRRWSKREVPWHGEVVARRIISWLSQGGLLLDGSDRWLYEKVLKSLNRQLRYLAVIQPEISDGEQRLYVLMALIYGGLCIADQDRLLDDFTEVLCAELDRQIVPDGGHISRCPNTTIELLLDLLPLRQCFTVRQRETPKPLIDAIDRAIPMLNYMRLGDGFIARFNGMSATWPDRVATILSYGDLQTPPLLAAPQTKYVRLQRRQMVLIMDAGPPPPLALSSQSHAGALSFELSSGRCPIIVNCGAPGPADQDWAATGRSTSAHSTLTISETSSSKLVRRAGVSDDGVAPGLIGPANVSAKLTHTDAGGLIAEAQHDGYVDRFGLAHKRILHLDAQGKTLAGVEQLTEAGNILRLRNPEGLTFAVHFHTHPRVVVSRGDSPGSVILSLESGAKWRFRANGITPSIEESVFLADLSGPLQAVRIALRGVFHDTVELRWWLEEIIAAPPKTATGVRDRLPVVESEAKRRTDPAEPAKADPEPKPETNPQSGPEADSNSDLEAVFADADTAPQEDSSTPVKSGDTANAASSETESNGGDDKSPDVEKPNGTADK